MYEDSLNIKQPLFGVQTQKGGCFFVWNKQKFESFDPPNEQLDCYFGNKYTNFNRFPVLYRLINVRIGIKVFLVHKLRKKEGGRQWTKH